MAIGKLDDKVFEEILEYAIWLFSDQRNYVDDYMKLAPFFGVRLYNRFGQWFALLGMDYEGVHYESKSGDHIIPLSKIEIVHFMIEKAVLNKKE